MADAREFPRVLPLAALPADELRLEQPASLKLELLVSPKVIRVPLQGPVQRECQLSPDAKKKQGLLWPVPLN